MTGSTEQTGSTTAASAEQAKSSRSEKGFKTLAWLVPLVFVAALWMLAPLRTALQFGADEGYELMKALLVSLGHPLYREVWNDQPPLHTEMVALLFRLSGPSAYAARLLSLGFAGLLVGGLYRLVSRRSGWPAGLACVALLTASPHFLELSVSVMLELPAVAMAVASAWALEVYSSNGKKRWLWISGAVFGLALQVKLTAALFGPAILAQYFAARPGNSAGLPSAGGVSRWRRGLAGALLWCGAAGIAFGVVLLAFYPPEALRVFWFSHFSAGTRHATLREGYRFEVGSLLENPASVPAVLGLVVILWRRRWDLVLPVVLLLTLLGVHLWHRPYWFYYDLHFDIALAWLGGTGIGEGFLWFWRGGEPGPAREVAVTTPAARRRFPKIRLLAQALAWSTAFSYAVVMAPGNLEDEWQRVSGAPAAAEDETVLALKRSSGGVHWIFTNDLIRAFWAGLPVPPELAIIPSKRLWSGQIDRQVVLGTLERYRPERILVPPGWMEGFGLTEYLAAHYRPQEPGYVRLDK